MCKIANLKTAIQFRLQLDSPPTTAFSSEICNRRDAADAPPPLINTKRSVQGKQECTSVLALGKRFFGKVAERLKAAGCKVRFYNQC